jgi:hypothetical protein
MDNKVREEARRRRAPLRAAAGDLERAASAPVGTGTVWRERVRESLAKVQVALKQHVKDTEGEEGLYIELRDDAPRLTNLVILLTDEHTEIKDAIRDCLATLEALPEEFETEDAEPVRESILFLLGKIARHRQKGADLIWRAYSVDIGGDS